MSFTATYYRWVKATESKLNLERKYMTSEIGIILPEVSRHVHIIEREGAEPLAGIISAVHDTRRISVAGFTAQGYGCAFPDIHLRQPDEAVPGTYPHARWMPYSVKAAGFVQAEPVEAPEAPLESGSTGEAATGVGSQSSDSAGIVQS